MLIAFVGPVVEELTFRGLGFTLLRQYGPGLAIATTGVLFALSHGLLALLPTAAAFGFGLAYLRSRTDSVYPGMLVHVLFNVIGVLAIVGS
jgi:membrane protease YdiL (CAAX protease family)